MVIPNRRISRHDVLGFEDRDNFIRNLFTLLYPDGSYEQVPVVRTSEVPPMSKPVAASDPILTLSEIKMHLRIEEDQITEDGYLEGLEMAARIHTQNILQRDLDVSTTPENVKLAMKLLLAHWYRNRESTGAALVELPLAYTALLFPEKDFPCY